MATGASASYTDILFRQGAATTSSDTGVNRAHSSLPQNMYQIDATAREVSDPTREFAISESGTEVFRITNGIKSNANTVDYDVDFLFGIITRDPSLGSGPAPGTIRIRHTWLQRVAIGGASEWSFSWPIETFDTTPLKFTDNGMERTFTLEDMTVDFTRFYLDPSTGLTAKDFHDYIDDRTPVFFEGRSAGTPQNRQYAISAIPGPLAGVYILRGWFLVTGADDSASVEDVEIQNVTLESEGNGQGASFSLVMR